MTEIDVKTEIEKAQQEIEAETKKLASILAQIQNYQNAKQEIMNILLKLNGRLEFLQSLNGKKEDHAN